MKKKIVTILFMTFLLTGCSINYELDFDEKSLKEEINISDIGNMNKVQEEFYDSEEINAIDSVEGDEGSSVDINPYYKIERKNKDFKAEYTYDYNTFYSSSLLGRCFDKEVYKYKNNTVYIDVTSINDECYAGPMTIKFKTDKFVDVNNADEVKGNEYIWNIKSKDNLNIEFSVILDKEADKISPFTTIFKILRVVGAIAVIVFLGLLYKKISSKETE